MRTRAVSVPVVNGVRGRRRAELVEVARQPTLLEAVVVNLARSTWRLLAAAARHPLLLTAVTLLASSLRQWGPVLKAFLVFAVVGSAVVWSRVWPASYERLGGCRLRARWRRLAVYARHWQPAMVTCGLAETLDGREWLPALRRVRSTRYGDAVLVDLLPGQSPEDYERCADALAHTFEARWCRVRVDRPGRVWLSFSRRDPLAEVVSALPVQEVCDPAAVVVGVAESADGGALVPWVIRLLGSHLLIAGATGSGKGSVLWSLIRGLLPGVRDGSVQMWAVDPKGGMELAPGAPLFARFAYADPAPMVTLLEDAVTLMRERAEHLRRAGVRLHTPTPADPLVVVVVDELAVLVAYGADRDVRKRAEQALSLLLSQGRAPGVLVVAAVQDPGKDVIPFRDLFPVRVALRLVEDVQVDMVLGRGARNMVLGRGARNRGAECDRIPPSLPGVGYVVLDGVREPVRVRAAHVTDEDLHAMTAAHRANSADAPQLRAVDEGAA